MNSTAAADALGGLPRSRDRAFLGHPSGFGYLAFTEAWERFSYYGMQALLVLYMVDQLLLPGHAEHVLGLGALKAALQGVYGRLSTQALSSQIFGLYTALVYVTPILGGLAGDRWLGRRMAVTLGALMMAAGHFMMAFDASFLLALLALILGGGLIKGNIAVQLGALYAPADTRRDQAFQIFVLAINFGAIASPLVCGTLGEKVGFHYGFAAAGVGMVIGLVTYLAGRSHLPAEPPRGKAAASAPRTPISAHEWRTVVAILCLLPVFTLVMTPNNQGFNVGVLWWRDFMNLDVFGFQMPVTWLLSVEAILAVIGLALGVLVWRRLAAQGIAPHEVTKIAIGAGLAVFDPLIKALFSLLAAGTGWKIPLPFLLTWDVIGVAAFVCYYPTGLALVARAAPPRLAGALYGAFLLFTVATNYLVGLIGAYYRPLGPAAFWALHACLPAVSLVILLAGYKPLKAALGDPAREAAVPF
jgi:POT family proton-dependent oligopeptide transporter